MHTVDVLQRTGKWALLSLGGPLSPDTVPYLRADAARSDLLVGVDGGTRHLLALGLTPQIVTGDFDSLGVEERDTLAMQGVQIVPTPDQDYTDCDKALRYVLHETGARIVRLYAGTGGRLDHLYSVLSAVIKHSREWGEQADIRLVDEWGETWRCAPQTILAGTELLGCTISLLALGPVTGITTTGVQWPLIGEELAPGVRDGTLNKIVAPEVTVQYTTGDLLVMLHHQP